MMKCTIGELQPGQYVRTGDAWSRIYSIFTYHSTGGKVIEFVPRPTKYDDIGNWHYAPDELDHVVEVKS